MVKSLKDEIEAAKKLTPKERISKLKSIEKKLKEEADKQAKEIEKLTKESQKEIITKEEEEELSGKVKFAHEGNELEEQIRKSQPEKTKEKHFQYGDKIQNIKDEIYSLQQTEDWGYSENKKVNEIEKKMEEANQYKGVMSKYAADQLDTSRKTLNAMRTYKS